MLIIKLVFHLGRQKSFLINTSQKSASIPHKHPPKGKKLYRCLWITFFILFIYAQKASVTNQEIPIRVKGLISSIFKALPKVKNENNE